MSIRDTYIATAGIGSPYEKIHPQHRGAKFNFSILIMSEIKKLNYSIVKGDILIHTNKSDKAFRHLLDL